MKTALLILVSILMIGCSKTPFSPEMKGIGFWESPEIVKKTFLSNSDEFTLNTNCLSLFLVTTADLKDYQLERRRGMGIVETMAQRASKQLKTVIKNGDLTNIEWTPIDQSHAKGSFDFHAFYGSGHIDFRALRINNEWVINYLAIPSKESSDKNDPYIIFEFTEEETEKLYQRVK